VEDDEKLSCKLPKVLVALLHLAPELVILFLDLAKHWGASPPNYRVPTSSYHIQVLGTLGVDRM